MDFRRKFLEIFETDNEHYLLKKVPFLLSMRMLLIASVISGIIFVTSNEEHLGGMLFLFLIYAFFLITMLGLVKHGKHYRFCALLTSVVSGFVLMPLMIVNGVVASGSVPFWVCGFVMVLMIILDFNDFISLLIPFLILNIYVYTKTFIWGNVKIVILNSKSFYFQFLLSFLFVGISIISILLLAERKYKSIQKEIEQSKSRESVANVAKTKFLSSMSQEIRSPLNAVIGMSELMLNDESNKEVANDVSVIKNAAYEILDIVDNVFVYSKLSSNEITLTEEEFNPAHMISVVLGSFSEALIGTGIKIRSEIDPCIPKVVKGDVIKIRQIISSLFYNSFSLVENGRIMLSVNVEKNPETNKALFKCNITDTGCGLSEVDLESVFESYDVYDSRQSSNLKGISLKYNICNSMLKLMNGGLTLSSIEGLGLEVNFSFEVDIVDDSPMVSVENASGKKILSMVHNSRELNTVKKIFESINVHGDYVDSYFSFEHAVRDTRYSCIFISDASYPLVSGVISAYDCFDYTYVITDSDKFYGDFDKCRVVHRPTNCICISEVLNGQWEAEKYISKDKEFSYDGSKAKILVVDDNMVNLKVASGIFRSYKIDIDMAKSGKDALEKLSRKDYDLVFMDMVMPEMSGKECLDIIRESENRKTAEVPVIALTATTGGNIRDSIISDGFQEYLAKPITQRYLTQVLLKFLSSDIFFINLKSNTAKEEEKPVEKEVFPSGDNVIDYEKGITNIGNNKNSYLNILAAYVTEGKQKLEDVPAMFENKDIKLFTTNVHGIKSSSASIGAMLLSEMFKALEMAGKKEDTQFIDAHLKESLDAYKKIMEDISEYLKENGKPIVQASKNSNESVKAEQKAEETSNVVQEAEPEYGDEVFTSAMAAQLKSCVFKGNLRGFDELMNDYINHKFTKESYDIFAKIKKTYDMFDYKNLKSVTKEALALCDARG